MSLLQAAALGLVQGITEFLPVSSSAHLAAFPWLFGWEDPGLAFDAALHLGTLAAAFGYYRRRWLDAAGQASRDPRSPGGLLLFSLALATVPAGLAGLTLEKYLEPLGRLPPVLGTTLIAFGLLLGLAARKGRRLVSLEEIGLKRALLIGCAQALALIPGVSRSGITITAGLFLGLTYEAAAAYSFLLSVPITLAASLHSLRKLPPGLLDGPFLVGVVTAGLSGALAIHGLLAAFSRWGVRPFVIYRVALGGLIWVVWLAR